MSWPTGTESRRLNRRGATPSIRARRNAVIGRHGREPIRRSGVRHLSITAANCVNHGHSIRAVLITNRAVRRLPGGSPGRDPGGRPLPPVQNLCDANGLTLAYSSGAVEGNVCRIKALKRQMFGRANLDLLRKRILLSG